MKMKKIVALLLLALLPFAVEAQDARQRTTETIIADGLAQLPADKPALYNEVMGELAATGAEGVASIAEMLVPAADGNNATVEYALSGITAYAMTPGKEALLPGVRAGLLKALATCTDNPNKGFLLSQLQLCASEKEAEQILPYLKDDYLREFAMRALCVIPACEGVVLEAAQQAGLGKAEQVAFAYILGEKRVAGAEQILLGWVAGADDTLKATLWEALARMGGEPSIKVMGAEAKAVGYKEHPTGITDAYLALLQRNATSKSAIKGAKALLKSDEEYLCGAALQVLVAGQGVEKSLPTLLKAIQTGGKEYRFAALELMPTEQAEAVAALLSKCDNEAKAAILVWLGDRKATAQSEVVAAYASDADEAVAKAAINAASNIGGEVCLTALIEALEGNYAVPAEQALLSFRGDIKGQVSALLQKEQSKAFVPALRLAGERHMTACKEQVFALLNDMDKQVGKTAYQTLKNVVTSEDADRMAALLNTTELEYVLPVQEALNFSLRALKETERCAKIEAYMADSKHPARYYKLLGWSGTDRAVEILVADVKNEEAFVALLEIDNPKMPDLLYKLASKDPERADRLLARYATLVAKQWMTPNRRYQLCRQALELNPSAPVRRQLVSNLRKIFERPALMLATQYLSDKEVAKEAAYVVKYNVSKAPQALNGEGVREALEQAREIYRELAKSDADAGYAVDEITELLSKLPKEVPPYTLSEEEQAAGFEILFDGKTLDNWTGNKVNYVPLSGTIDVTAQYGGEGNLYTVKEYSDFVLRFEFCFLKEGVNNGIGIRTRPGVDAAYDGMEIQILDHDAPIYRNLKVHQQHGSVYGIIAAKRVKFPSLGTWNSEEIRVEGDRITVTVNGEVILDGNIREACQGKSVAPKGEKRNPYTIDHKNHPGLFNKKGNIALCGHGAGIQFRNMRVLDLSEKK